MGLKITNFCPLKDTIKKSKRQMHTWRNYFKTSSLIKYSLRNSVIERLKAKRPIKTIETLCQSKVINSKRGIWKETQHHYPVRKLKLKSQKCLLEALRSSIKNRTKRTGTMSNFLCRFWATATFIHIRPGASHTVYPAGKRLGSFVLSN